MRDNITHKHFKSKIIPYSKKQAFYASVLISLLINALIFMGLIFGRSYILDIPWSSYLSFFFWHLGSNIFLFYLLFLFNFRAIKKRPVNKRQGMYVLLGTFFICIIVSPVLSEVQWFLIGSESEFATFAIFNLVKDLIVGIIVIMMSTIMSLYLKREQTILTNQKLMQENIRVKYESLKNQLDPHFLFNSLNTLNGLVGVDDDKAHDYIDNMSSVFRYTLHSKSVCTLEQEMEFVEAYYGLLKIRYGDSLQLISEMDPAYKGFFVIPVSVQLLVENAVKHNVISNSEPLLIIVQTTSDNAVTVRNRINPKLNVATGGVGLANLSERYSMMYGRSIEIEHSNGEFSVTIPLIKELVL